MCGVGTSILGGLDLYQATAAPARYTLILR